MGKMSSSLVLWNRLRILIALIFTGSIVGTYGSQFHYGWSWYHTGRNQSKRHHVWVYERNELEGKQHWLGHLVRSIDEIWLQGTADLVRLLSSSFLGCGITLIVVTGRRWWMLTAPIKFFRNLSMIAHGRGIPIMETRFLLTDQPSISLNRWVWHLVFLLLWLFILFIYLFTWLFVFLQIWYEPEEVLLALQLLLKLAKRIPTSDALKYDIVDVSRQSLQLVFRHVYEEFQKAVVRKDLHRALWVLPVFQIRV